MKELAQEFKGELECLGENMEKDISSSAPIKKEQDNDKTITYKIRFIDICRFLPSKLSNLVDSLSEILLPTKNDFYSELKLEDISDKDYEHAQKVFKEYCTDMGDYHDLYVQTDTLLLAAVFEKFRDK